MAKQFCECRGECSLPPRHLDLRGFCYERDGERVLMNLSDFTGYMCTKCLAALRKKRLPRPVKPGPQVGEGLF